MKKYAAGLFTLSLCMIFSLKTLAAGASGKEPPVISAVTGFGADITVSWEAPEWDGIDQYEVQLGKTNEAGSSFLSPKSKTVDSSEFSYDFTVNRKGYYTARVRAKDVGGKYTAWSSNGGVVIVKSEDVSEERSYSSPFFSQRGPGVKDGGSPTVSPYVKAGPGAQMGAQQSSQSAGSYSQSSSTQTRKRVQLNTYTQNGWQSDKGGRWYLFPDGSYPVSCWEKLDGKFYHFDGNGYMEWNRWVRESDGSWRFCTASGEMALGWNNISEKWYYMEPANGVMLEKGEHSIGGRLYYMNEGGDRVSSAWVNGYYYGSDGARSGALIRDFSS